MGKRRKTNRKCVAHRFGYSPVSHINLEYEYLSTSILNPSDARKSSGTSDGDNEGVGALSHSKRWRDVVAQLAESSGSREDVAAIANAILKNVRIRFRNIHLDNGVIAAFQCLVALPKSASAEDINANSISPKIDFEGNPSTLKLIVQLRAWLESQKDSNEYAVIAMKASADAISRWSAEQSQQATLFTSSVDASEIWQRADSGAGFCEVSRLFFSNFTERYLTPLDGSIIMPAAKIHPKMS